MSQDNIDHLINHLANEHGVALRTMTFGISISLASLSAGIALGDGTADLDKRTPAISAQYRVGFLTRKSTALRTTDFGSEYISGLNAWTGKSKNIGIGLTEYQSRTHFTQVDAAANTSWTDATLTFRYMWFYPTIIIGDGAISIVKDDAPVVSALCLTAGFGLDFRVPASQYVITTAGAKYVKPRRNFGNETEESVLGYRSDYMLEVAFFPSLEWMSVVAGYRARFYQVRVANEFVTETELGPNLGLSFQYDL